MTEPMTDDILNREHRNRLIELFSETAEKNVLTVGDCDTILDILRNACERAKAALTEEELRIRIESGGKGDTE